MTERPDVAILLPNLAAGGAERVCLSLAGEFAARGLTVEMVVLRREGEWIDARPDGVGLVSLDAPRLRQGFAPLLRYLRERRPRAMLAALWPLTSLAVWARMLAGGDTRLIVSDHSDYLAAPEGAGALRRLKLAAALRASYPFADAVVGVSEGVADSVARLSGLPRARVAAIYNPIAAPSPGEPPEGVAEGWLSHGALRLIAVGSLNPAKNYPLLMRALRRVREQADARLLILGEGRLRPMLEGLAADLGLTGAIDMPGYVANPAAFLRKADLMVLASSWEGFSNVIVEAMACGVPVVSTDCRSGPREILRDGRLGRLVPVGDEAALAAGILASLNDNPDREVLIRRAADFSVAGAADAYLELLLPSR